MYPADTVLKLKKQRKPDKETNEKFAYNRVRVVGPSPVSHASKGEWTGADAAGVIVTPLENFGGVIDEPFGKLVELYEVESQPEPQVVEQTVTIKQASLGPTPEEVFKTDAPGVPAEPGQIRGRSPLPDVVAPSSKSVLDD